MYVRKIRRAGAQPLLGRALACRGVCVPQIEAEPQAGAVYLTDNVQKHRRVRLHDVFQTHRERFRHLPHQPLPQKHRARDEPLRVIYQRHKARVQYQLRAAKRNCLANCLAVALFCDFQHERVNCGRAKLVEWSMQHKPIRRGKTGGKGRFQIAGAVLREKLGYFVRIVQECRRAELGKLQPESVILRRLRRVVRNGREIQQLFFHAPSDTPQNKKPASENRIQAQKRLYVSGSGRNKNPTGSRLA